MKSNNKTEELVKETFNILKSAYDLTWDPKDRTLHVGIFREEEDLEVAFRNTNEYLVNLINRHSSSPPSRILDVCTGTGRTLLQLTESYGCRGTGVDLSEEQIRDANENNNGRCSFFVGSASKLRDYLNKDTPFSHVISQDGLFLVDDKERCLKDIYGCLAKDGLFVFSDFLAEGREPLSESNIDFPYKSLIGSGLSYEEYLKRLRNLGFTILHSETRGEDMIRTYQALIPQTMRLLERDTETRDKLVARYNLIIKAVKEGKLDWGWFVARK